MKFKTWLSIIVMLSSCNKFEKQGLAISSKRVGKIIANNCIDCHKDYSTFNDRDFVYRGLIVPNKHKSSFLYATLKGAGLGVKELMPPQGQLSSEDLLAIREWINNLDLPPLKVVKSPTFVQNLNERMLSEEELLARCYGQLTRKRLSPRHGLLKEVSSGKITGLKACERLLDKATLDENGTFSGNENLAILKNLQALHLSWFSELNFYNNDEQFGNFELYDPGHLGAYYSYAFFAPRMTFSELFTGKSSFELIRKPFPQERDFFIFPYQIVSDKPLRLSEHFFGSGYEISEDNYPAWDIPAASTGELIGLKEIPRGKYVIPKVVDRRKGLKNVFGQNEYEVNADLYQTLGGGIIGNPMYLILNMKLDPGDSSDGGKRVPRKWGLALFKDFLCRDLPVAPLSLAPKYVKLKSSHTFRTKQSCVQCHMSMDGVSGVIRNLEMTYSIDEGQGRYIQTSHIYANKLKKSENTDLLGNGSEDYQFEPTTGRFVFKSFNGMIYDRKIASLDDLGETLIEVPDLYRCVVNRYLHFLTGISIDLNNPIEGGEYPAYLRHLLLSLTNKLQKHQSLKQTVKDIMATPVYRDRFFLKPMNIKTGEKGEL